MPKIISVNPAAPDPHAMAEAAGVIEKGGIISFPTRCLYGLGADAWNAEAVDRVFDAKDRPYGKPILILVKNLEALEKIVRYIPPSASRIIETFWPGSVTIVFEANESLPISLTAGTGKIGVRLPAHPVASALVDLIENPMTGTSANIAGCTGCSRISDLAPRIAEKLDLVLDAGPLEGGVGSTVVDVTGDVPKILREGAVPSTSILS
ncbi:MAG: threonylcarbamoyl-AMP synthase [Deltaproteobacteria bacterium]|nr:threonylcarbamoyl-AMP synthase [Deltaproteobacteria bacterium]